jgi:hypothetical protein
MIHFFAKALEPIITELPFIERWGGAAFPITFPSAYEDPETGGITSLRQAFPISCSLPGDCDDPGYYQKLLPDDAYKSVAWLEGRGTGQAGQDNANAFSVRQEARLAVWLNLQKIGDVSCGAHTPMMLAALKALLSRRLQYQPDYMQIPATVSVTGVRLLPHDPADVFGSYFYAVQPRLFLHPFSFFGLELQLQAEFSNKCLCLPEYEPIDCIVQW